MTSSRAILEAVVQRALLGTQRASAAAAVPSGDLQSLISRIDASNAERALLSSAAIVSSYELAGRLPTSSSNASATAPAALEADDRPEASAGVARFLTTMLGGVNDEVLREWLTVVAARGWRVPTPMLPVLLDVGQGATYLRELIIGVLGQRGRWLAARNEQWGWAALPMQSDDTTIRKSWETGTPAERAALLRDVRARAAGMGRELVESTWKEDTPAQRAEFVEILGAVGPTIADEAFLEAALDDRRQEVRRAAADVLSHMAASALVARMTARAIASLGWKQHKLRKDELTVEPPKELDDAAERDGVARKAPTGIGERAWWLAQIIACVPRLCGANVGARHRKRSLPRQPAVIGRNRWLKVSRPRRCRMMTRRGPKPFFAAAIPTTSRRLSRRSSMRCCACSTSGSARRSSRRVSVTPRNRTKR